MDAFTFDGLVLSELTSKIARTHGRRAGLKRYLVAEAERLLGRFRPMESVDWSRVKRLVFVCKGNICRSAYADQRAQLLGVESASFGVDARSDDPADSVAIEQAAARGVNLDVHRARRAENLQLASSDLLLAMEPWQAEALQTVIKETGAQVTLLGLWSEPRRAHIEDPFGLSHAYFSICMGIIDSGVERVAARCFNLTRTSLPRRAQERPV